MDNLNKLESVSPTSLDVIRHTKLIAEIYTFTAEYNFDHQKHFT